MNRHSLTIGAGVLALSLTAQAAAQDLSDRLAEVREQRQAQQQGEHDDSMAAKLQRSLGDASLQEVTAREALQWLSDLSDIHILVNWDQLEMAADPDTTVQIPPDMTAGAAIDIVVQQMEEFDELIWEPGANFVQIMTKEQANQRSVMRIYPIEELLMEMPHFDQSPSFDLNEITRGENQGGRGGRGGRGGTGGGTTRGGGGGGRGAGGGGLFSNDDLGEDDPGIDREERAEQIAELIREIIEPEIWQEHGGTAGSIRYHEGHLIVRAPMYVHRQIGIEEAVRPTGRRARGATENPESSGTFVPRRSGALQYPHSEVGIR